MRESPPRHLTDKQAAILVFISEQTHAQGFPPSYEEIGAHFGITKKTAWEHVRALQDGAYVARTYATARGLKVLRLPPSVLP